MEPAVLSSAKLHPLTGIWRNSKNKKLYEILFVAIEATNSREGSKVVVYQSDKESDGPKYVREEAEFRSKFKHVCLTIIPEAAIEVFDRKEP